MLHASRIRIEQYSNSDFFTFLLVGPHGTADCSLGTTVLGDHEAGSN